MVCNHFWRNKRVLVTGHSGFKGAWLVQILHHLGARVIGISLAPDGARSLFEVARVNELCESIILDIRNEGELNLAVSEANPEVVFHLAAQSLVRYGYDNPVETFSTNVLGSVNLLNALRGVCDLRACIVVTTDKVYTNRNTHLPFKEADQLGGVDPYSASKSACELVVGCYQQSYFNEKGVSLSTVRAGNVIGGGDWALDRLLPDIMRSWENKQSLHIRSPLAIRPWQHVLEPLFGYIMLAEKTWGNPDLLGAYNFGPHVGDEKTVGDVVELCAKYLKSPAISVQYDPIFGLSKPESQILTLDSSKAHALLGYLPAWNSATSIKRTVKWYLDYFEGGDPRALCIRDLVDFLQTKQQAEPRNFTK